MRIGDDYYRGGLQKPWRTTKFYCIILGKIITFQGLGIVVSFYRQAGIHKIKINKLSQCQQMSFYLLKYPRVLIQPTKVFTALQKKIKNK